MADSIKTGLKQNKIPKRTLIKEIFKRDDNQSLAVKSLKDGILIYWNTLNEKHLKANKEILDILSYDEIEQLFNGNELYKEYSLSMFNLEKNIPN